MAGDEERDRIGWAVLAVLRQYRRHWQTAGDLRGHLPGIPESALVDALEGLVATGHAAVTRGASRTSYRLTPTGVAGKMEEPA